MLTVWIRAYISQTIKHVYYMLVLSTPTSFLAVLSSNKVLRQTYLDGNG